MKRPTLFCIITLLMSSSSFSFTQPTITIKPGSNYSLQSLITKTLFSFKDEKDKEKLNEKLKTGGEKIKNSLSFRGLTVEDLDLSGMDLAGIDFSGGIFSDVNFTNADLRDTLFNGCKFKRVTLENALLYKDFRVKNWSDHYSLVKQYSDLMKDWRLKKATGEFSESKARAICLNKFFPALGLNFHNKYLQDFDLTEMNLENANLCYSFLEGARLSENVTVPVYTTDRTNLFNFLVDADPEKKAAYNKLFHAQVNMFSGVDPNRVREFVESNKKDLRNVCLAYARLENTDLSDANLENAELPHANLQGTNLTHANLEGASLESGELQGANLSDANLENASLPHAKLQGANLTDANLKGTSLAFCQLQGAILSSKVTVPIYTDDNHINLFNLLVDGDPDQKIAYGKLFHSKFDMIIGVNENRVREFVESNKKDLSNVNLGYARLEGTDLSDANLENARLVQIDLKRANLTQANLKEAVLYQVDLQGANLINADLRRAYLQMVKLSGSDLQGADLYNTDLRGANLNGAKLSGSNMQGAKLAGARLNDDFNLPNNCEDKDLIGIYNACLDKDAKKQLKAILDAKKIPIL